jgi:hypothetical protein
MRRREEFMVDWLVALALEVRTDLAGKMPDLRFQISDFDFGSWRRPSSSAHRPLHHHSPQPSQPKHSSIQFNSIQ